MATINTIQPDMTENTILKQIDRKIIIKYLKEGKTSRTYVFGLDDFIKKEDIENFMKKVNYI